MEAAPARAGGAPRAGGGGARAGGGGARAGGGDARPRSFARAAHPEGAGASHVDARGAALALAMNVEAWPFRTHPPLPNRHVLNARSLLSVVDAARS